jgi:hypothetical protein
MKSDRGNALTSSERRGVRPRTLGRKSQSHLGEEIVSGAADRVDPESVNAIETAKVRNL